MCADAQYTLSDASASTHGVLHHFWITGNHGPGQIDEAWISYYVDGEPTPSIEFQPARMCGQFFPEMQPSNDTALYSAGSLCGRNSNVGGWFNTFPVPFARSIVVTARPAAAWAVQYGCLHSYINVRGTEGLPVVLPLSGVALPPTARLQLQRHEWAERQALEYVNVTTNAAGERGMVFMVGFAVEAKPLGGTAVGGGYIEGCWQFYRQRDEAFPGLVVGTGLEDYFDSAFYFGGDTVLQRGVPFANALAGLPYFGRDGVTERISACESLRLLSLCAHRVPSRRLAGSLRKFVLPRRSLPHERPVGIQRCAIHDPPRRLPLPQELTGVCVAQGGGLVWRVGEGHQPLSGAGDSAGSSHALRGGRQQVAAPRVFTKCGNQYPTQAQDTAGLLAPPPPPHRETSAVNVSTYGWVYVW